MKYSLQLTLPALSLLVSFFVIGCNVHQTRDLCLPQCDDDDEVLFEDCVAFGGGPGACRPGNRECCALAAGCVGEIGDQVVESPTCPLDIETVSECGPPCAWLPDAAFFWQECMAGNPDIGCAPDDGECCADEIACVGPIGDLVVLVGDASCCATDADCGPDAYCAPDFDCRLGFDCSECEAPRVCDDTHGCACETADGELVVDCPDGDVCGPDGICMAANPCDGVICDAGATCVPFLNEVGLPETECLVLCFDDFDVCGPETSCDFFSCQPDASCFVNDECLDDRYCALPDPDAVGLCDACDRSSPDVCGGGDSDCDGMRDEDCEEDICGNGILDGSDEECDGDDLGGARCSSLPGLESGYLSCDGECRFETRDCSTEICDNGVDDDRMFGLDCDDSACFSDPACCSPSLEPEICDGYDDDCDFVIDEDCTFPPEDCFNGFDDDGDTIDDCDDPDCASLLGTSCGSDVGACTFGTLGCGSSAAIECIGGDEPSFEMCDGIDNDCNGSIDDGDDPLLDCRSGDFCGSGAICTGGECATDIPTGPCDDGLECTDDSCDAITRCSFMPRSVGAPCAGGDGMCLVGGVCSL